MNPSVFRGSQALSFSWLLNGISSFFFFFFYRNQAMRKKLILYFKRRNHARKQWVSDSPTPYCGSIKQPNSLCQKEKEVFLRRCARCFAWCTAFAFPYLPRA